MRVIPLSAALLCAAFAVPAMAQSFTTPSAVPEIVGDRPAAQPAPDNRWGAESRDSTSSRASSFTDSDSPRDYLTAAKDSLAKGRTRAAQEALEMAETRLLNRSVRPEDINRPDSSSMVQTISEARQALNNGRIEESRQLIDNAISR